MAGMYNFRRGDTFTLSGTMSATENGAAVTDFTGYTGAAELRDNSGTLICNLTFAWVNAATGVATISDSSTANWPLSVLSIVVALTSPAGVVTSTPHSRIRVGLSGGGGSLKITTSLNSGVVATLAPWFAGSGGGGGTDVTLAGSLDYLTLSGQEITRGAIDLTTDVTGILPIANFTTGTADGTKFIRDDGTLQSIPGGGDALVANPLSQFAATTSAQLAGVLSDKTGAGALVFGTSPTLVTPALGTPSALVLTNATGLPEAQVTGHQAALSVSESQISDLGTYSTATGVENNADVTDAVNVAAAGALMASGLGSITQAYDADTLKSDTDASLTGGFAYTAPDDGTKSSGTYTPSPAGGNLRSFTNNGAFTLAAPTYTGDFDMTLHCTNGGSAGAVTFSGFAVTPGGDALTVTSADTFFFRITKLASEITCNIEALQ